LVVALTIAVVFWALGHLLVVVVPVIFAVCLVTVLQPATEILRRHRWPPVLATTVVAVGALLVLGGVIAAITPATVNGIDDLASSVGAAVDQAQALLGRAGIEPEQLQRGFDAVRQQLVGENVADQAVTGVTIAVEVLAGLALMLVLTVYLLHSGHHVAHRIAELVPQSGRHTLRHAAITTWTVLGSYIRGTAIVGLVDAVSLAVGLVLLGVPLVIPLAVLTFFGAFLPLVGAIVTGLLAAVVALVAQGPLVALAVVGLAVLVQQLEGNIVQPRVFSQQLDLHPVLIICAISTGATIGGVLGAFLSVPMTAVGVTLLRERSGSQPAR
jgi:predicted PurR-regulated permease PerM